jgi:hypothetical protein
MRRTLLLLAAVAAGGITAGLVYFLVTRLLHIVGLMAIGSGMVGLGVFEWIALKAKLRNVFLAAFLGFLIAIIAYSLYQAGNYFAFRQALASSIGESGIRAGITTDEFIDQILKDETGFDGYLAYMIITLKYGFNVTYPLPSNYSGGQAVGLMLIDLVAMTVTTILGTVIVHKRPYCEHCQKYYSDTRKAHVKVDNAQAFLTGLKSSDFQKSRAYLVGTPANYGLDVYVACCDTCDTSPIELKIIESSARGQFTVFKQLISPEQYDNLFGARKKQS